MFFLLFPFERVDHASQSVYSILRSALKYSAGHGKCHLGRRPLNSLEIHILLRPYISIGMCCNHFLPAKHFLGGCSKIYYLSHYFNFLSQMDTLKISTYNPFWTAPKLSIRISLCMGSKESHIAIPAPTLGCHFNS